MTDIEINLNPNIPALPRIEDKTKINVRYTLISPYVSVHIYWNKQEGELLYELEEPILDENEKALLNTLEISLGEKSLNHSRIENGFLREENIHDLFEKHPEPHFYVYNSQLPVDIYREEP